MNWLETIWIGLSAASLALGVVHLFVWFEQKSQVAHLLFFALAASATAFGAFELTMMHSPSPVAYAATLRWAHVPLAMSVLSVVWFVHFHFDAGRLWLAWAATGLRLLALALNFGTGVNINFSEVSALDPLTLWGGVVVAGPVGSANPMAVVPQIGNLLLLAFVIDASITLWRRGGADARRRAIVVGGGVVVCVTAVSGFAALITLDSFEAIEQLRDTASRWAIYRAIRDSGAVRDPASPALRAVERVPNTEIYVIDVSFAGLKDAAERDDLNQLPTSFVLSAEAVDRLRSAAGTVLAGSEEFARLLRDLGGAVGNAGAIAP